MRIFCGWPWEYRHYEFDEEINWWRMKEDHLRHPIGLIIFLSGVSRSHVRDFKCRKLEVQNFAPLSHSAIALGVSVFLFLYSKITLGLVFLSCWNESKTEICTSILWLGERGPEHIVSMVRKEYQIRLALNWMNICRVQRSHARVPITLTLPKLEMNHSSFITFTNL